MKKKSHGKDPNKKTKQFHFQGHGHDNLVLYKSLTSKN